MAVAWVYFSHRNDASQTLQNILGSLLQQLVRRRVNVSQNVRSFYKNYKSQEIRPDSEALVPVITTVVSTFKRTFIIIDALDEAVPNVRTRLLEILRSLPVSLLVTSRSMGEIRSELEGSVIALIPTSSDDLSNFVEAELTSTSTLERLLAKDPKLRDTIISKVIEKSEGM